MCGRYWADASPDLREIVEEMNRSPLAEKWSATKEIKTYGEIRPTDVTAVIATNQRRERRVFPMKWGFAGRSLLINARSETAAEKPTFREAWERRRCIVPASYYFEWEHMTDKNGKKRTGDKYSICPKDSNMTWMCGLYRMEEGLPTFVILTREPGEGIRFIHDRMPLILPEQYIDEWIRPEADPGRLLEMALTEMEFWKDGEKHDYNIFTQ